VKRIATIGHRTINRMLFDTVRRISFELNFIIVPAPFLHKTMLFPDLYASQLRLKKRVLSVKNNGR